jgi:hypothetical protein
MSVKVQSVVEEEEKEVEEKIIGCAVVIMFILFSASITLLCYFSTYLHRFHCQILWKYSRILERRRRRRKL